MLKSVKATIDRRLTYLYKRHEELITQIMNYNAQRKTQSGYDEMMDELDQQRADIVAEIRDLEDKLSAAAWDGDTQPLNLPWINEGLN